jgi:predicted ArsR family transcriptional regulator
MKIKEGEYITVKEMANKLKLAPNTIKQRLFYHNIKPLAKDALYSIDAFEAIKNLFRGRPPKKLNENKRSLP